MPQRLTWRRRSLADPTRIVMLVLALAYLLPAPRHVALFFAEPTCGELMKRFGAAFAIVPPAAGVDARCR